MRLAVLGLSSVVAFVLFLLGSALFWDKVYLAQRPALRIDGHTVTLKAYANLLSFQRNVLEFEYYQAADLANQPLPAGADPSQNVLAQFGAQRMNQIQQRLTGLPYILVEDIVEEHLVRAEAARRNITATPEEIEAELKQRIGYRDPEPASTEPGSAPASARTQRPQTFEAHYREYRRATGGTDDLIRGQIKFQILQQKLYEDIAKGVPATGEHVKARHILVADEGVAHHVLERLRAGETFDALAAEFSMDTSNSDKGGDLGWFGRGMMVPEFEDAVFQLQPGQLGEPIKTTFGWHIVYVDEKDAERPLDGSALDMAKNAAYRRWLEEANGAHRIERLLTTDMIEWASVNGREPARARSPR